MKVLHVVPWYEPAWSSGGTAIATSSLCRELVNKGIDVTVYATNDKGEGKYLDIPLNTMVNMGGVKVSYFSCGFCGKWKAAMYSRGMSLKLHNTLPSFDLVHIGGTRHWHGLTTYKLCKKYNKPYIITPHASLMEWWIKKIGNQTLKLAYMYLIDRYVLKNSTAIHYLCEGERLLSRKYDFNSPSFIVPNGISVEDYKRDLWMRRTMRDKYGISDDMILMLHLGRIHPQKNIHLIIDALHKLSSKTNILKYFVVGPISDHKYYQMLHRRVKKYMLGNTIKFLPPVDKAEVQSWYSMSDIMVLPSKVEGISMALIEALSCSLPVLVSKNVANYREIEEDSAGIIVEPNVQSIKSALHSITERPENLGALSQNALRSARTRHSISNVANLMIKAYQNIQSGDRDPQLQWS